jgi:hypothetical protein
VLAYGNIHQPPAQWSAAPEFRDFVNRRITGDDMLGFQLAFDVTGDPAFPERPAARSRPPSSICGRRWVRRPGRRG